MLRTPVLDLAHARHALARAARSLSSSAARGACAACFSLVASALHAQAPGTAPDEGLADLSLEELMNIEVTIASGEAQSLTRAPAAVYVITGDEIRRAGFTSIQEALRMVPGFVVANAGSSKWSVNARGPIGGFANQLMVMVDGLSLYTPLFAGVWWELAHFDMASIERIEVIRGPGATLWGSNAVNGIVNVITKNAAATQGLALRAHVGSTERIASARYGGELAHDGHYRVWFSGRQDESLVDGEGDGVNEDWEIGKLGFRADWELASDEKLTLLGNAYAASIEENYLVVAPSPLTFTDVNDDTPKTGFSALARWERRSSPDSSTQIQSWLWRDHQKQVDAFIDIDSWDVEVKHSERISDSHRLLAGIGYRLVDSSNGGDFTLTADPEDRTLHTLRGFLQDEISLPEHDLVLLLGAQIEHNRFTGVEVQPSLRATWTPLDHQTFWGAISRSVRTPSIDENDLSFLSPIDFAGTFLQFLGDDDVESEELIALELGWRYQPSPDVTVDLSAFHYEYDDLVTSEEGAPFVDGAFTFIPIVGDNKGEATATGLELALDWDVSARWRVRSAWTLFDFEQNIDSDSNDFFFDAGDTAAPRHQANLRSYYQLAEDWELDAGVYYVDSMSFLDNPSYVRADLRLGYNPSEKLRMSFGVQNLTDSQHPELGEGGPEVERTFYASVSWRP